jgi:hypothetical protein
MIGKIQRVPLREVWRHEALDFTRWLQDNIDVLNDVLDLTLSNVERERAAGDFNIDLTAEDQGGNLVIIENQLEKSNHEHLGKIITYLTAIGAKSAIWIVSEPRPEHVTAITWLNESRSASFYLLKVEAIRIGDSSAAPLLTLIVGPSEETRVAGDTKEDLAERHIIRHQFWTGLLESAKERTRLHSSISPGHDSLIATGAGKSGLYFQYNVSQHEGAVELYIDRGKDSADENKAILDALLVYKTEIEQGFGAALQWRRLESKRACKIRKEIHLGGYRDEERWPEIQDAMIDAMELQI